MKAPGKAFSSEVGTGSREENASRRAYFRRTPDAGKRAYGDSAGNAGQALKSLGGTLGLR
jgi:hypothetical protein